MATQRLILDRYRPTATAGAGGFATVYKAWDTLMQRDVAIKEIKLSELDAARAQTQQGSAPALLPWEDEPGTAGASLDLLKEEPFPQDPAFLGGGYAVVPEEDAGPGLDVDQQRFLAHIPGLDEARTAAFLQDPHIVAVYDLQLSGTTAYLIMEYVEGASLTTFLSRYEDQLTLDVIACVFHDVAHALQVAHEKGVLHLDIKPDNILINKQGEVKVTDFGLATLQDAEGTGHTGGGTIGYMPLEQMNQEKLDARCDEWALASVAYEMFSGQNPFFAPSLDKAADAIRNAELVLPSLMWDNLSTQADDVLFYALDPCAEERYETVEDFAEELQPFLGDVDFGRQQIAALVSGQENPLDSLEGAYGEDAEGAEEEPRRGLFGWRRKRSAAAQQQAQQWADGDDNWDNEADFAQEDAVPLRVLLADAPAFALGHAAGALMTFGLCFFCLINVPSVVGAGSPVMWGLLLVGLVLGGFKPHVGALYAYLMLAAVLCMNDGAALGVLLFVAAALWWYLVGSGLGAPFGRDGKRKRGQAPATEDMPATRNMAAGNLALCAPVLGAVGLAPVSAGLCGLYLSAGRALATAALGAFANLCLACLGSMTLAGWDALSYFRFTASGTALQENAGTLLGQPATWVALAAWLAAAVVLAVLCKPGRRWLAVGGSVASAALLAAGAVGGLLLEGGKLSLAAAIPVLVPAAAALVVLAAASCIAVPRR